MNRTFHYRISWINCLTILIVASATAFFLWNRSAVNVAIGFVLMLVAVKMIERIIHTEYVFTDDGMLIIDKGRFSRKTVIPVNEILSAKPVTAKPIPVRFILIEYGAGHVTSAQPVNEKGFIEELKRRQEQQTAAIGV